MMLEKRALAWISGVDPLVWLPFQSGLRGAENMLGMGKDAEKHEAAISLGGSGGSKNPRLRGFTLMRKNILDLTRNSAIGLQGKSEDAARGWRCHWAPPHHGGDTSCHMAGLKHTESLLEMLPRAWCLFFLS